MRSEIETVVGRIRVQDEAELPHKRYTSANLVRWLSEL
jgi:hypothetical protein